MLTEAQYKRGLVDSAPVVRLLERELAGWEGKTVRLTPSEARRMTAWQNNGSASFSSVDRLFCRLGMVAAFFEDEELAGEYASVSVGHGDRVLVCDECGEEHVARRTGGKPKRFCSQKCRTRAQNRRRAQARVDSGRYGTEEKCPSGHLRSKHALTLKDGRTQCLVCIRRRSKKRRAAIRGGKLRAVYRCGICRELGHNAATHHLVAA